MEHCSLAGFAFTVAAVFLLNDNANGTPLQNDDRNALKQHFLTQNRQVTGPGNMIVTPMLSKYRNTPSSPTLSYNILLRFQYRGRRQGEYPKSDLVKCNLYGFSTKPDKLRLEYGYAEEIDDLRRSIRLKQNFMEQRNDMGKLLSDNAAYRYAPEAKSGCRCLTEGIWDAGTPVEKMMMSEESTREDERKADEVAESDNNLRKAEISAEEAIKSEESLHEAEMEAEVLRVANTLREAVEGTEEVMRSEETPHESERLPIQVLWSADNLPTGEERAEDVARSLESLSQAQARAVVMKLTENGQEAEVLSKEVLRSADAINKAEEEDEEVLRSAAKIREAEVRAEEDFSSTDALREAERRAEEVLRLAEETRTTEILASSQTLPEASREALLRGISHRFQSGNGIFIPEEALREALMGEQIF